jgi:hypothetical protein
LQCDNGLAFTALMESQINDGLLILSQLAIGDKLADTAVAQQVFSNMLNHAVAYVPVRKHTYSALVKGDPRATMLSDLNLAHDVVAGPLAALKDGQIAVVEASPANLKLLAANKTQVDAFCNGGGWLMLWGLTPQGLADYGKVVGYKHAIRKFDRERVLLASPMDSMASGLTLRDVVLNTGQKMYRWMALMEPDRDSFDYVVDHTDIAPFCKFPTPMEVGKSNNENPGSDHWPRNMVNGFTSDDNWVFTYTIIMDMGHKRKFTLELPKEEELVALKLRPSKIYHPITKMKIYFDDDPTPVVAEIPVREQPITEDIPVPGRTAKRITLEVAEWAERGKANIVVIDNLWLQVKRSDAYMKNVSSLLNIGGLMRYNVGKGGIVLNQFKVLDREVNPVNKVKKSTITKTLLKNMGAVFAGSKVVVAGLGLQYEPVIVPDGDFNAYVHKRNQPAWFDGPGDLGAIPVGEQRFANVDYFLSDFHTSPVPSVFMLGTRGNKLQEQEIKGIKVGKKADALFFLHTFHKNNATRNWENQARSARQRNRAAPPAPWVFKYVVHYADGTSADAQVLYSKDIGNWATPDPKALQNAALAWVAPLPGARNAEKAAVYSMQWNNPNPDKVIVTIDIVNREKGSYGAPAVFAITSATTIK